MRQTTEFNVKLKDHSGDESYRTMVRVAYEYFNTDVLKDKKKVEALSWYKGSGYNEIRDIFGGHVQATVDDFAGVLQAASAADPKNKRKPDPKTIWSTAVAAMKKAAFDNTIVPCVGKIKVLDHILQMAPPLTNDVVVYRGLRDDILDQLECEGGGERFVTFKTFISTSFSPTVSEGFAGVTGCMCELELPKGTRGSYVSWSLGRVKKFQNSYIDNEKELILPRGCKFEVTSIDYYPNKQLTRRYSDFDCDRIVALTKLYRLKLVAQASMKELRADYAKLLKTRFSISLNDVQHLSVEQKKTVKKQPQETTDVITVSETSATMRLHPFLRSALPIPAHAKARATPDKTPFGY